MDKPTAEEAASRWDRHAEQLAAVTGEFGDINKEVVLTPVLLDMLGEVAGKRILDAGCGEGFLSRLMAGMGARVTGVDLSAKLLEIANERTPAQSTIDYILADLERLDALEDASFDLIVSSMALQDLPDYQAALRELFRVLKPGGDCIIAILHPCFSSDGGWVRDEVGKRLYWKVDNYFSERSIEQEWPPGAEQRPLYFHRTLTSYFKAFKTAGFTLEALEEPYPSPQALQQHPEFAHDLRMSHFLVFRLGKAL